VNSKDTKMMPPNIVTRVSGDPNDKDYCHYSNLCRIEFNGEPITGVITADSDEGTILVYVKDKDGKILVKDKKLVTELKYGEVKIIVEVKK